MRLISGYTGAEPINPLVDMTSIQTHVVHLWGPVAGHFPWLDRTLRQLIGRMVSVQFKVSYCPFFRLD